MKIETTVLKAALLQYGTNIDGTASEYVRLLALADTIRAQARPVIEAAGGHITAESFSLGNGGDQAMTLDLTMEDINRLRVCMERMQWPFSRFSSAMREAVMELHHTVPTWAEQAEAEANLAKLTPEQRRALLEKES